MSFGDDMKKKILAFILIFLLVIGSIATYKALGTLNPVMAAVGLARVCLFDDDYARTGIFTKAYVSQNEGGFDLFLTKMADWGYIHLPEEQMGSTHIFADKNGELTRVTFLVNRYFAKWIWY